MMRTSGRRWAILDRTRNGTGLVVDDLPAALAVLKAVPGVHGIAGKPEKWVQLPDGLTLEMFQANEDAIDAALANKLK